MRILLGLDGGADVGIEVGGDKNTGKGKKKTDMGGQGCMQRRRNKYRGGISEVYHRSRCQNGPYLTLEDNWGRTDLQTDGDDFL